MIEFFKGKALQYLLGVLLVLTTSLFVTTKVLLDKVSFLKTEKNRLETNFTSQVSATNIWRTRYGQVVAESITQTLTSNEIIKSRDSQIIKLTNQADKLNIKIKNLEYMLSINMGGEVDTTANVIIKWLPGEKEYVMYDTLKAGDSYIYRVYKSGMPTADYKIGLGGSMFVFYEGQKKQGKWRLINLFVPREKLPIVTVTTDNPWIMMDKVKMVVANKNNR